METRPRHKKFEALSHSSTESNKDLFTSQRETAKHDTIHKLSGPIIKHRIKILADSQRRKVVSEIISKGNHGVLKES